MIYIRRSLSRANTIKPLSWQQGQFQFNGQAIWLLMINKAGTHLDLHKFPFSVIQMAKILKTIRQAIPTTFNHHSTQNLFRIHI